EKLSARAARVVVVASMLLAVTAAPAFGTELQVCVPEKEGGQLKTPKKGACSSGFTMTELPSEEEAALLHKVLPYIKYEEKGVGGKPTVEFSGVNVQIVNGSGKTETTNGAGNLIVGYDERPGSQTGSHNLVVGSGQTYTSFGAILGGLDNTGSGPFSDVFGVENTASGSHEASVTGGRKNTAGGEYANTVSGGEDNLASGEDANSISGGKENSVGDVHLVDEPVRNVGDSVSGGVGNTAFFYGTSVSGGASNVADDNGSSVSGGTGNQAAGVDSSVSGGSGNTVGSILLGEPSEYGDTGSISGGGGNTVNSSGGWIGGGSKNLIPYQATAAAVSGGYENIASQTHTYVGGGERNTAHAAFSAILGGKLEEAVNEYEAKL
ncbi:MAG TPA: hypothetical protein VED41_11685, partial [Solirubrobacteraceae bacterium]|nr:hypothetical protein [Solirubrobacteraceae bacterium]